jgi:Flp pilus assembly protein protease CpaA
MDKFILIQYLIAIVTSIGVTVALITDFKTGIIYNWTAVPLYCFGLIMAFCTGGWLNLLCSFMAGLLFFVTSFRFSEFGGGDFKLSMAVGACLGMNGWSIYFIGMGTTVVILSIAVKIKTYTLKELANSLVFEQTTKQIIPMKSNFAIFEKAAKNIGYKGTKPVVVGAIRVAAGTYLYTIMLMIGGW